MAHFSLRFRHLEAVVRSVAKRKQRGLRITPQADLSSLARLIGIYRSIRPFFFTANGNCLLHALSLINFLSHYHLYPTWTIGVRTAPWAAHTWVQYDQFVLDTKPEKVDTYTAILAI
jgi:hypothetical protein